MLLPAGQRASGEWIDPTLRARVEEQGLLARTPLAGEFPRQRVEVVRAADPTAEVNRLYRLRGWTDGLPIVPPTLGRLDEMIDHGPLDRHAILGEMEPLGGVASVEKIAANTVMAGFIVNGPAARRLGVNAGWGALGPGWTANATIGRAVRLVMTNIGGGWPGAVSFAGLGQPARYSLCLAEREGDTPWPALHIELGYRPEQSTVTVMRAETVINVTGGLDELASVIGSAASLFGILHSGKATVILSPFTARRLAGEGWTRADVRRELYTRGRLPAETWRRSWIHATVRASDWPEWARAAAESGSIPAVREPDDLTLVVAGADLPIPQHAYCPSWGHPPCRVTREIVLPATGRGTMTGP